MKNRQKKKKTNFQHREKETDVNLFPANVGKKVSYKKFQKMAEGI